MQKVERGFSFYVYTRKTHVKITMYATVEIQLDRKKKETTPNLNIKKSYHTVLVMMQKELGNFLSLCTVPPSPLPSGKNRRGRGGCT